MQTRTDKIMYWLVSVFPGMSLKWYQIRTLRLINELNQLWKETRCNYVV